MIASREDKISQIAELHKLCLKPGEVLVVTVNHEALSPNTAYWQSELQSIRAALAVDFPSNSIVVATSDLSFSVQS